MKVRQTNVSDSDKQSARGFFDALRRVWELKDVYALDAFARNGQLTIPGYISHIKDVDAWELGPEHEMTLKILGATEVKIGDSYAFAQACERKYGMVVIDTPQGAHHDSTGAVHFEHFDFFRLTLDRLLQDSGIVVLYVNKRPYDKNAVGSHGYDEYEEYDFQAWMEARAKFYGSLNDPTDMNEEELLGAYRWHVQDRGWLIDNMLMVPCFSDVPGKEPYAFRLGLELRRA